MDQVTMGCDHVSAIKHVLHHIGGNVGALNCNMTDHVTIGDAIAGIVLELIA